LSAIEFCHRHCLIHRDIKPSNLLYDTITGQLKLCDFGLSRIVPQSQSVGTLTSIASSSNQPQPMTPNVVSLWYRAPELLLPTNTTAASASTSASTSSSTNNNNKRNNKSNSNNNIIQNYNIQYSFPIDLWSTGCVIAELLQGYPFLDGKSEIDQIQKMIQTIGRLPTNIYQYNQNDSNQNEMSSSYASPHQHQHSQSLWDKFDYLSSDGLTLLTRLLEYDPNERWDAKHALQSNYFINLSTTTTSTTTSTSTNEINNDMMMPKQFHFMD
jgi:serine/threonine protein kinase